MESVVLNKSQRHITDPEAAAFLTHAGSVRYIEPFLGRECTLKEAAAELRISMSGLLYWTERMLALDLLEVTRTEQRRGRPIKHYRATAESFFVPFHLTRAGTYADMLREREKPQQDLLIQGIARVRESRPEQWGILLSREEGGIIRSTFTSANRPEPRVPTGGPAVLSGWITAYLTPAQALRFQARMLDLLEEVAQLGEAGEGEPHVLHVGIAPTGQDHS